MTQRFAGPLLAIGLIALMAPARPSRAAESQPAAATLDVDKTPFNALSEPDRRALQEALTWTGDFSGTASGLYGPRTREALAAFKARVGLPPAVALDEASRDRLLRAAEQARKDVGFAIVTDAHAGLRIGLPLKLLPKVAATASGTRYSGADGVDVDTVTRPAGDGGLPEVFARMSAAGPSRTISYKLLRAEFFVVSGEANDRNFYARFGSGTVGEAPTIRGFTISYPKAAAKRMDPVALAVAGSFVPFPGAAPVPAPLPGPAAKLPSAAPAPAAEAVFVAPGTVLAKLSRAACPAPAVDGVVASWRKEDAASGLALLDLSTPIGTPVTFAAAAEGDAVLALFHSGSRGTPGLGGLLAASADLRADGSRPEALWAALPLQGEGGAVLVNRSGALVGLAVPHGAVPLVVGGTVLEARYDLVAASHLADFVGGATVATTPHAAPSSRPFGDVAGTLERSVVSVGCTGRQPAP